MPDALAILLQSRPLSTTTFAATSRYSGLATSVFTDAGGTQIPYVQRRFLPQPNQFATLQLHTVTQGERIDTIAAQYLTDPQQFWRICDANGAMRPEDLTATIGRSIRITLPQGIQMPVTQQS